MPVDVATMPPTSFHSEGFFGSGAPGRGRRPRRESRQHFVDPETKAGDMCMYGPAGNRRQSVHVKVYRTSLEHFAVILPQKKVCKPMGVINLKNTSARLAPESEGGGLVVRQRGFDSTASLRFVSERPEDAEEWLRAFTAPKSATVVQTCLPVLEEDDEN